MPKWVSPRHSVCSCSSMERKWYFGIFYGLACKSRRTKHGINICPFFTWHLECNERCRIKNMISNFVAPKFMCGDYSQIETRFLLDWTDLLQLHLKIFSNLPLSTRRGKGFFLKKFVFGLTVSTGQRWLGQRWPAALIGLLGLPDGPRRCARQLRAYKCPILAHLTSFLTFLSLLTSEKFFGATRALSGFGFSALICCFSLFCTRGQCLFFFFFPLLFFFFVKC